MCEKEPKRRSCTTCPQYDGAVCQATGFQLGDKETVLASENRRGFICVDTGEGTPHNAFVMTTRIVDSDSDAKSVDYPKDNPNQPENQQWYTVEARANVGVDLDLLREYNPNIKVIQASELEKSATADCIMDMLHKGEGGPFTNVFTGSKMPDGIIHMVDCNPAHAQFQYRPEALPKYAGSPSSECPSRREGPPQKGKIDENNPSEAPLITSGTIVAGQGIQLIENPGPMWKDTNGYWEPIKPRSCTTCKLYNDPICMKIGTHIGNRAQIWQREDLDGFQCIAAMDKEEREAVITSIRCNNRKEIH